MIAIRQFWLEPRTAQMSPREHKREPMSSKEGPRYPNIVPMRGQQKAKRAFQVVLVDH